MRALKARVTRLESKTQSAFKEKMVIIRQIVRPGQLQAVDNKFTCSLGGVDLMNDPGESLEQFTDRLGGVTQDRTIRVIAEHVLSDIDAVV